MIAIYLQGDRKFAELYNVKNTVYVAGSNLSLALSILLHELKHFTDKQVYGNVNHPYFKHEEEEFLKLKKGLRQRSTEYMMKKTGSSIDRQIYAKIYVVFADYPAHEHNAEMLVKVPEILGFLGIEKGTAWLEKNEPELLKFYVNNFNRACEYYLAKPKSYKNDEVYSSNILSNKLDKKI